MAWDNFAPTVKTAIADSLTQGLDAGLGFVVDNGGRGRGEIRGHLPNARQGAQTLLDHERIERRLKAGHVDGGGSHARRLQGEVIHGVGFQDQLESGPASCRKDKRGKKAGVAWA